MPLCFVDLGGHAQARAGPVRVWPGADGLSSIKRMAVAKNRATQRLAPLRWRCRVEDLNLPLSEKPFSPPRRASSTKVSKPVLFAPKMPDFQWVHKRDSALPLPLKTPIPVTWFWRRRDLNVSARAGLLANAVKHAGALRVPAKV